MNLIELDHIIFYNINGLAGKYPTLDYFGIFFAKYLIWLMVFIILVWWFSLQRTRPSGNWPYEGKKKWLIFGQILVGVGLVVLINQLLSLIHFRERPFINLDVLNLLGIPLSQKSFPSDHAAISFAMALAIIFYNKKLGWFLLVSAILVSFGRIFVGVHYPLDVLGGFVIAALTILFINWLMHKYYFKNL